MDERANSDETKSDAPESAEVFSRCSRALLWRDARADVRAARAVLADQGCESRSAAIHLLQAWEKLARVRAEATEAPAPERRDLAEWVRGAPLEGWSETSRSTAAEVIDRLAAVERHPPWQPAPEAPSRRALGEHSRTLERLLAQTDATLLDGIERKRARRRWLVRAAVLVAVMAAAGAYLMLTRVTPSGPWRVEYYPKKFKRTPIVTRAADLDFDWGTGPPTDELGIDRWSARFHTCLVLDSEESITFALSSDDGSQLFVDGEVVVDNSGTHTLETKTGTVDLVAGTHDLQVDYVEEHGEAAVRLRAAIEGSTLGPIPTGLLLYPGDDPTVENPCVSSGEDENDE